MQKFPTSHIRDLVDLHYHLVSSICNLRNTACVETNFYPRKHNYCHWAAESHDQILQLADDLPVCNMAEPEETVYSAVG